MEPSKRRKNPPSTAAAVAVAVATTATGLSQLRDWSSLTEPLLLAILRRLDTLQDSFAFLGVCRSWRALAAPSPDSLAVSQHPLLLTRFPGYTEAFYDIVSGRRWAAQLPWRVSFLRSVAYAYGYFVTAADSPGGSKLLLWNIFTDARIRLPKSPMPFSRVLLSSRPDSPGCLVLVFGSRKIEVQYLQIDNPLWTVIDRRRSLRRTSDVIFFENKLYALTSQMQLFALDLVGGLKYEFLGKKTKLIDVERQYKAKWLAVSGEDLLAVCEKLDCGFMVFRWDFGSKFWEEVLTLGGMALFMGAEGFAGSAAASEMGIRGDCIYYLDYYQDRWFVFSLEDQSIKVISLKDQSIKVVSPASRGGLAGLTPLPPIWVFPTIR